MGPLSADVALTIVKLVAKYDEINTTLDEIVLIGSVFQLGVNESSNIDITSTLTTGRETLTGLNDLLVNISDDTIVSVTSSELGVLVTALAKGESTITFTDPDDDSQQVNITFKVNNVSSFYSEYPASNGLNVKLNSLRIADGGTTWNYTVNYTFTNNSDLKLDEIQWQGETLDGSIEDQYGFFNSLFPAETMNSSHLFRVLKDNPIKVLTSLDVFAWANSDIKYTDNVSWILDTNKLPFEYVSPSL